MTTQTNPGGHGHGSGTSGGGMSGGAGGDEAKALPDNLPATLAELSGPELAYLCDLSRESPDDYYAKYGGQSLTVTMQNTTYSAATITVRCDDAANMDRVAGGKCGLHFTIIQGLKTQKMNSSATTSGGYSGSEFYKNVLPNIIKALPQEFQDRFEDLYVDVNLASSGSTITPVAGKMHLVTMRQWFGDSNLTESWVPAWWKSEETWLKWNQEHNTANDRIIKNDGGSDNNAWTSSVYNTTQFGYVVYSGNPSRNNANNSCVPALGFSLTNNGENPGTGPWKKPALYLAGDWKGEDGASPQTIAWAPADSTHRFLDETGGWSRIDTTPPFTPPDGIADASWEDIARLADLAAADPEGYKKYIGQEKTFTYGGYNVTARIVGVAQDTLRNGGKCGFTFHIYRGMGTHNMNGSDTTAGGYASTAMKTWLEGLAFPADLAALLPEFEVKYRDTPTGSAKSLYAKVALMSAINLYWPGCGADAYSMSSYFWPDEGETYQYFKDNDTTQARIHYNNSGGANYAWLLSPYYASNFIRTNSNGNVSYDNASDAYVPSARFCLGSSI